jgi:hypothetical protein
MENQKQSNNEPIIINPTPQNPPNLPSVPGSSSIDNPGQFGSSASVNQQAVSTADANSFGQTTAVTSSSHLGLIGQTDTSPQSQEGPSMPHASPMEPGSSQPKKRKSLIPIILLSGLLLLVIGIVGYNNLKSQTLKPPSEAQVQEILQNNSTEVEYSLSTEATRFGAKTNASIKVPKGWKVEVTPPSINVASSQLSASDERVDKNNISAIIPSLYASESSDNSDFEFDAAYRSEKPINESLIINEREQIIAGSPAKIIEYKKENMLGQNINNPEPNYEYVIYAIIKGDNALFQIRMSGSADNQKLPTLFKESLSSFSL